MILFILNIKVHRCATDPMLGVCSVFVNFKSDLIWVIFLKASMTPVSKIFILSMYLLHLIKSDILINFISLIELILARCGQVHTLRGTTRQLAVNNRSNAFLYSLRFDLTASKPNHQVAIA